MTWWQKFQPGRHGLAALVSGLLLFVSLPPLEWSPAAWVALVPLLVSAARLGPAKSFRAGLMAGLVFWWPSLVWLARVSWPGWLILGVYCAFYIAGFSMLAAWLLRRRDERSAWGMPVALLGIPALWVGFEYLRSVLCTGFPWNPLGVSQVAQLPLIQWAEWGGVYAVSFLIVMVNTGAVLFLMEIAREPRPAWRRVTAPLLLSLAILVLAWAQGTRIVRKVSGQSGLPLRVAAIQLNVPQFEKWVVEQSAAIEARLLRVTMLAINRHHPELVVWPETAVPTFARDSVTTQKVIAELLTGGVPLLVGTMDFEKTGDTFRYFNSSFLYDPDRGLARTYAKRHLVIFGEYVPWGDVFPILRRLTPIEESFTPGKEQVVFRLDTTPRAFSVLICFEDTVAALARDAVLAGARLLINQTNDAWFDPSWAARQHMLQGVFRCVENRVPAVRSTNTGITCFIDRTGKVSGLLAPGREPAPAPEYSVDTVLLPGPEMPLTFYTRHGDIFAGTCIGLVSLAFGAVWIGRRRLEYQPGYGVTS